MRLRRAGVAALLVAAAFVIGLVLGEDTAGERFATPGEPALPLEQAGGSLAGFGSSTRLPALRVARAAAPAAVRAPAPAAPPPVAAPAPAPSPAPAPAPAPSPAPRPNPPAPPPPAPIFDDSE